ncbi:MAG: ComEC family competence protein [Bacilli bacterium]|nr:ComEC family competence protein [Bacilli bacterium]
MKNDTVSRANAVLTMVILAFASGIAVCGIWGLRTLVVVFGLYSASLLVASRMIRMRKFSLVVIGLALLSGGIYQTGYAELFVKPKLAYSEQQTVFAGIVLNGSSQPTLQCNTPVSLDLPLHFSGHPQVTSGWVVVTGRWQLNSTLTRASGLQQLTLLALRPGGYIRVTDMTPVYTVTHWQQLLFELAIWKQQLTDWPRQQLTAILPADEAALLLGIVFGQTADISASVASGFTALGITHLLAASGANILALVLPLRWVLRKIRITGQAKRGLILLFVWVYYLLAGGSISICRAAILVSLYELRPAGAHLPSFYRLLLISFLFCLLLNPFWLFDIGFQLTFIVTCGLVTCSRPLERFFHKKWPSLMQLRGVSRLLPGVLVAESLSFPLIAFYFHQWSFLSVLSNLTLTPLVELLVPVGLLLVLLASVTGGWLALPAKLLGAGLSALSQLAAFAGSLPGVNTSVVFPGICLVLYYASFLLLLLSARQRYFKWSGCAGLAGAVVCLTVVNLQLPRTDQLQVWFLDVGQGDATLIRLSNGHFCLIDGGGSTGYPNSYDVGRLILLPALRKLHVNQIDCVILTDSKATHAAGLIPLFDQMPVEQVVAANGLQNNLIGQLFLSKVNQHHIPLQFPEAQTILNLDPLTSLQVLQIPTGAEVPVNERIESLVFSIDFNSNSILFAGDLTDVQESSRLSDWPSADVLKVSRGGGKHSTSEPFLNTVNPTVAVISSGRSNSKAPVDQETLDLLLQKEMQVYRTDLNGTIHLTVGSSGLQMDTER